MNRSPTESRGIEPRPTLGIGHLTILRNQRLSLLCWPEGDFDATTDPTCGLYHRDARYLSTFKMTVSGTQLIGLASNEEGYALTATMTNPDLTDRDGHDIAGQTIVAQRQRVIGEGMLESLSIANYGKSTAHLALRFDYGCDFEDIFVVRGYKRESTRPGVAVETLGDAVEFRYVGLDEVSRTVSLAFHPTPTSLDLSAATFELALAPGDSASVMVRVGIDGRSPEGSASEEIARAEATQTAWVGAKAAMESSNSRLDDLFQRCMGDIHALGGELEQFRFLAAGVPWFDGVFGRDSLIAGMAMLGFAPELLKDALELLAAHQATSTDARRDAEPGKIPHELRFGELANTGEVPFGRYYGSVDATPLYVIAAREYYRWTWDETTVKALMPSLERAMQWCLASLEENELRLLTYFRESPHGLEHQGWKDSEDGICHPDGSPVKGPIALIEVQAYLAAALHAYEELCEAMGITSDIKGREECSRLTRVMHERFMVEGRALLALDGDGQPIRTAASNGGHALWAGACSPADAERIAERLMRSDMFSGWGIRTLASGIPAFNPLGYHIGSIWPHDNAIILAGFRRYGMFERLGTLGHALLDAMVGFADGRIPELFSGESRNGRDYPTPYPVASRPQAWSAASLPWTLISLLGITPGETGALYVVKPCLPPWLDWVSLRDLRFGESSVDLTFRRDRDHTGVEVERQTGPGSVVLAAQWPLAPIG